MTPVLWRGRSLSKGKQELSESRGEARAYLDLSPLFSYGRFVRSFALRFHHVNPPFEFGRGNLISVVGAQFLSHATGRVWFEVELLEESEFFIRVGFAGTNFVKSNDAASWAVYHIGCKLQG